MAKRDDEMTVLGMQMLDLPRPDGEIPGEGGWSKFVPGVSDLTMDLSARWTDDPWAGTPVEFTSEGKRYRGIVDSSEELKDSTKLNIRDLVEVTDD